MKCNQCVKMLADHLDQDLQGAADKDVLAHLAACAQCRAEKEILERIESAARALPRVAPGSECVIELRDRIRRLEPGFRRVEFGPVMDMDELAAFLRVDLDVVGQYLDEMPSFELGGKLLFRRKSDEDWIAGREMCRGIQRKEAIVLDAGIESGEVEKSGGITWKL